MNLVLLRGNSSISSPSNRLMNYSSSLLHIQHDHRRETSLMANDDPPSARATHSRTKRLTLPPNRRSSSPAFNGKQQTTKRSVNIDNNNNDLSSQVDENSITKKFKSDAFHSNTTKVDACVETVSIGLATEPDQLGPCEPGTSVVLEGIVWNETDSGVLVVNVTWRGKTYVGTLLDSTKQDWACPRLLCESPTSDYDPRQNSKNSRTKRSSTRSTNSAAEERKLRHQMKSRQSKRIQMNSIEENNSSPQPSSPSRTNGTSHSTRSKLIPCPENQCHKQFTSEMALNFHLNDAHRNRSESTKQAETIAVPAPSSRDEEDVAHILVNVAEYVRRSSPDHPRSNPISWPSPQISSFTQEDDQGKFSSSHNEKTDFNKKSVHAPTPPPSSSPAYSDISDEDPEPVPLSTGNLLTSNTQSKPDEPELIFPNAPWTTQMLLQQYGSFIQQQVTYPGANANEMPSNRLNSKISNDSTVTNILDSRCVSTNDSKTLYHYPSHHLTSPNENLLQLTTTATTTNMTHPIDFSLNSPSTR